MFACSTTSPPEGGGNLNHARADIELIEGDIRSYHTVAHAVKGVEAILHQAALPSVPRSINDPITTNDVNVGVHLTSSTRQEVQARAE
ncbi:hypothetical protein MASR1M107_28720 [Ignavibacteriales bacterium]